MTSDELRALADALEPMAKAPRFEDFDVPAFCAWVRAQADAQPVAWRCEVRDLLTQAEQCLSTAVQFAQWAHDEPPSYLSAWDYEADHIAAEIRAMLAAAPVAPQAEPCIGNDPTCPCQDGDACHYRDAADGTKGWPVPQAEPKLGELMREQRNSRIVAGAYPDGNPNAGAIMAQTSQAEPKREPLSDEQMTRAAQDVLAERRRQIEAEGWTPEHDDQHSSGEMAAAAAAYALHTTGNRKSTWNSLPEFWPWHFSWWKPSDRRRNLVKAGALILAEIERLDRMGGSDE